MADLNDLAQRNISLNRVLAHQKAIELVFHPSDTLPTLVLDRSKVEQVLNNLIGNAVKYSHPGTRVTISIEAVSGFAVCSVSDQGLGIPAEEIPKLFKAFGRTSVRATGGEQSTGLGLAIVRRIVEGLGGRITVESEVGKGSTFTFTLPFIR